MIEVTYEIVNDEGQWEQHTGLLPWKPRELVNKSNIYAKDMFMFWIFNADGKLVSYRYPDAIKNIRYTGRKIYHRQSIDYANWREQCQSEK